MSTPTDQADSSAQQGPANRNTFLHLQAMDLVLGKPAKRPLSIKIFVNDEKISRTQLKNDKHGNPSQWNPDIYLETEDSLRFVITKKRRFRRNKTYKNTFEAQTAISYLLDQDESLNHVFPVPYGQGSLMLNISLPDLSLSDPVSFAFFLKSLMFIVRIGV
ncbi:hypothetical protein DFH11DRAFT_1085033 [Phellopilus nigrolimitatus]|nr:hypothetical protein DFH11DRAFT_1085033 [Phellopilus nigrolimitatus]